MSGTDHPPSTTRPAHLAPTSAPRRALLTCVAAVSAIAIGIAVVAATVGGTALAAASEPFAATTTSILRDQRDVRAQDRGEATLANIEDLAVAVAPHHHGRPGATTTPPPAPPTTVAPPPPPAAGARRAAGRHRAAATTTPTTPPPGTASPSASPAATGPPTPATATTAASSSPSPPGRPWAAPADPTRPPARPRSPWASGSGTRAAGSTGPPAPASSATAERPHPSHVGVESTLTRPLRAGPDHCRPAGTGRGRCASGPKSPPARRVPVGTVAVMDAPLAPGRMQADLLAGAQGARRRRRQRAAHDARRLRQRRGASAARRAGPRRGRAAGARAPRPHRATTTSGSCASRSRPAPRPPTSTRPSASTTPPRPSAPSSRSSRPYRSDRRRRPRRRSRRRPRRAALGSRSTSAQSASVTSTAPGDLVGGDAHAAGTGGGERAGDPEADQAGRGHDDAVVGQRRRPAPRPAPVAIRAGRTSGRPPRPAPCRARAARVVPAGSAWSNAARSAGATSITSARPSHGVDVTSAGSRPEVTSTSTSPRPASSKSRAWRPAVPKWSGSSHRNTPLAPHVFTTPHPTRRANACSPSTHPAEHHARRIPTRIAERMLVRPSTAGRGRGS